MCLLVISFDISNFSVSPPVDVDFRLYQEISCVPSDLIIFLTKNPRLPWFEDNDCLEKEILLLYLQHLQQQLINVSKEKEKIQMKK